MGELASFHTWFCEYNLDLALYVLIYYEVLDIVSKVSMYRNPDTILSNTFSPPLPCIFMLILNETFRRAYSIEYQISNRFYLIFCLLFFVVVSTKLLYDIHLYHQYVHKSCFDWGFGQ